MTRIKIFVYLLSSISIITISLLLLTTREFTYFRISPQVSNNSVFIYRVYLDRRGPPKLRVLAVNPCTKPQETVLSAEIEGRKFPLIPKIIGACPSSWDSCTLGSYIHEVELDVASDEVIIRSAEKTMRFPLHKVEPARNDGLTICVPPLYWFADWTKLILFIEYWKRNNAVHFIFYHHSSTKDVKQVLRYYEDKGIASVIPWPLLPSSPDFNPNDKVYRLAHLLALNDCVLRVDTEFVTPIDVDELLLSHLKPNSTIFEEFAKQKDVGSVSFSHTAAFFKPPLIPSPFKFEDVTYAGVENLIYKNRSGPVKTVARTNAIDIVGTHAVSTFRNKVWKSVTAPNAALLHIRYNFRTDKASDTVTSYEIEVKIDSDPAQFRKVLINTKNNIFPQGAVIDEEIQNEMGKCMQSWRTTQGNCKAPVTYCRTVIEKKAEWVEEIEEIFSVL